VDLSKLLVGDYAEEYAIWLTILHDLRRLCRRRKRAEARPFSRRRAAVVAENP